MELSINDVRELLAGTQASHPFTIGQAIIARTVTYHYTGRVTRVEGGFVFLADAAWIAYSCRWADTLKAGALDEVEPYPGECAIQVQAIVDWSPWNHLLPREQK